MARHTKGTKQIVSLSLDSDLFKRVENLADAKGMSRSALIEEFIKNGIGNEEIAVAMFKNPVLLEALMKAFAQPSVIKEFARSMHEQAASPQQLELFHQGLGLVKNYSEAFQKGVPPELAAKQAVSKNMVAKRKLKKHRAKKK